MKTSIKSLRALFLLLLSVSFLVAYANSTKEPTAYSNSTAIGGNENAELLTYKNIVDSTGCAECIAAFKACTAVPQKRFTDEIEKVSGEFKSGKIKRKAMDDAFAKALEVREKATDECADTFEKCCLEAVRKSEEASKAKSKQ